MWAKRTRSGGAKVPARFIGDLFGQLDSGTVSGRTGPVLPFDGLPGRMKEPARQAGPRRQIEPRGEQRQRALPDSPPADRIRPAIRVEVGPPPGANHNAHKRRYDRNPANPLSVAAAHRPGNLAAESRTVIQRPSVFSLIVCKKPRTICRISRTNARRHPLRAPPRGSKIRSGPCSSACRFGVSQLSAACGVALCVSRQMSAHSLRLPIVGSLWTLALAHRLQWAKTGDFVPVRRRAKSPLTAWKRRFRSAFFAQFSAR